MLNKIDTAYGFEIGALKLRSQRQQVLAGNIANADTPGYKAVDFDFSEVLAGKMPSVKPLALNRSQPKHMPALPTDFLASALQYRVPHQANIDGNTVELDAEMARFADNASHYQAGLLVLQNRFAGLERVLQETR